MHAIFIVLNGQQFYYSSDFYDRFCPIKKIFKYIKKLNFCIYWYKDLTNHDLKIDLSNIFLAVGIREV